VSYHNFMFTHLSDTFKHIGLCGVEKKGKPLFPQISS
jgi:hypothetical protein